MYLTISFDGNLYTSTMRVSVNSYPMDRLFGYLKFILYCCTQRCPVTGKGPAQPSHPI